MDELESKLTEIKMELCNNYKKTIEVKKLCDILQNEEDYNDHDYTDNTESQSTLIEVKYYMKLDENQSIIIIVSFNNI